MKQPNDLAGFSANIQKPESGGSAFLFRAGLAFVLFLGLVACLYIALGLSLSSGQIAILLVVGGLYGVISCGLPEKRRHVFALSIVLVPIYVIVASAWIIVGWNVVMNQIFAGLEIKLGRIFPQYDVDVLLTEQSVYATIFLVVPVALCGIAAGRAAFGKPLFLIVLWLAFLAAAVRGLYKLDIWTVVLLLGTSIGLSVRTLLRNDDGQRSSTTLPIVVFVLVAFLLACLPAFLTNQGTVDQGDERRRLAERQVHELRYEQHAQLLPEGDFTQIDDYIPDTENIVLDVRLSKPAGLYLRGFVGERYLKNAWTHLPPEQKAKSVTEFSWLHSRDFYGQNQLSLVSDTLNSSGQEISVDIENKTGSAAFRYAPYELATGEPDPQQIADADLPSTGLRGERAYSYALSSATVAEYEQLRADITHAWQQGKSSAKTYLENEAVYRQFVYDNYLDVPAEPDSLIDSLWGSRQVDKNSVSFIEAKTLVSDLLTQELSYSETPEKFRDGDFLTFLLTESRGGYSVHYATAATLLFRSLGIPARYVEGYYLAEEDAAVAIGEGRSVEVDESSAHAWVEIYRDGVGFVPYEIESTDPFQSSTSTQTQDAEEEPEKPLSALLNLRNFLWVVFVAVMIAALIFSLLALRRLWILTRRRQAMANASPNRRTELATAYAVDVLRHGGIDYRNGSLTQLSEGIAEKFGTENSREFLNVVHIQQTALFSGTDVGEQQGNVAPAYARELAAALRRQSTVLERFRMRYLHCIF